MSVIAVVANPVSDEETLDELRSALVEIDHHWLDTTEGDPGVGMAKKATAEGASLVIACGGDGTVRACAEGLVGTNVPMGIIPAGTGNLLARNLGLPDDVKEALLVALDGETIPLDTGEADGETFTVMAGMGLDAVVMEETDSERKDQIGSLAYFLEGIRHFGDEAFSATVTGRAETVASGDWATVLVGNMGKLQGGVDLFPESSARDGKLDLLAISGATNREKLAGALGAATGIESESLSRSQGEIFVIESDTPVRYEIDGESRHQTNKLTVKINPGSLLVRTGEGL